MPMYDLECDICGLQFENYLPHWTSPNPRCEVCGSATHRLPSRCNFIWGGTLDRFSDSNRPTHSPTDGGHIAYRVRSSRMVDGSPEPVRITTRQEQREFCRAEGLMMPDEMPQNIDFGKDGKSASSQGMPGSWASVNPKVLAEERAKPLPTVSTSTVNVVDRSVDIDRTA